MVPPLLIVRNPVASSAVAAGAVALFAVAIFTRLRRRLSPAERERRRRQRLAASGRIVDGSLIDVAPSPAQPDVIIYRYRIAGVTYECSQNISSLSTTLDPLDAPHLDLPIQVRYDSSNPTDSIVLAETWSGLWSVKSTQSH